MNINFSKMQNHPMNRDGETIEVRVEEGDLVGLTQNADGDTEIVAADADSSVQQPAIGVVMEDVQDPSNINVNGFEDAYIEQRQLRREAREREGYTLVGDEATYVTHGVYMEDEDGDLDLTPNEPVYLDVGGGVTQTAPSNAGELHQVLGLAVNSTTFLLDVNHEYSMA